MKKSDFFYQLPKDLIAQFPTTNRQDSRLLHLNRATGVVIDRQFTDFVELINSNDILIFNDTKVIPARLYGKKATGGNIEILIERILDNQHVLVHVKASKSPKPKAIIELAGGYQCEVLDRQADLFELKFLGDKPVLAILDDIGHIPLPPYITRADEQTDADRYQSIFARQEGAVASPTASLHFDETIMRKIHAKKIATAFVTLHVGSGTFQPVRVDDLSQHIMHKEYYTVPPETVIAVNQAKANGGRVVAIGTTSVRALESASLGGELQATSGDTNLFITPGYRFNVVDALLTNFHLPESTLLMLVSAFASYDHVMAAYQHAIAESYRFFSYGDAMFIAD